MKMKKSSGKLSIIHVNGPVAVGIILKTFSTISETFMPLDN